MITRAILCGEPAGEPTAHVAGLPVLLRQLLSLQDAGVTVVEIEAGAGGGEAGAADPRLRLRVVTASPVAGSHRDAGSEPVIRARPGLVWHPDVPRRAAAGSSSVDLERAALLEGEFVVPTATAAQRDTAEELLLGTLFKPSDGIVSRTINRRISLRVSRSLLETPITPNQMTLVAAVFGFAGIASVLAWGPPALIPGAILVQIQSILDGCDGELSRLKYLRSRRGEWLDQVFDDLVNLGFFAAAGWTLFRAGSTTAGWLTLVGTVSHLIYQAALYAALLTRGGGSGSVTSIRWWGQTPAGDPQRPPAANPLHRLRMFIELAGRRDFFTFLYVPAAVAGATIVALAWAAIIFTVSGLATGLQWLIAGGPKKA